MKNSILEDRKNALENSFFRNLDSQLVQAMKEKSRHQERHAAMTQASGITDPGLLDQLLDLEIDSETLAALTLVPLVEVAWADGAIAGKERESILEAASGAGLTSDSEGYVLLSSWLDRKPPPELFTTWEAYVRALAKSMDADGVQSLKEDVIGRVYRVAESAGGFLGFGKKVSAAEQTVLDRLDRSFG